MTGAKQEKQDFGTFLRIVDVLLNLTPAKNSKNPQKTIIDKVSIQSQKVHKK
jgi:hypothetical protein